jgi:hypothetical protein
MRARNQTPLRCPICDGELADTRVRNIGDVTANLLWQIHAGRCPEHGWFQTEVISKPPREIFPVHRLGGATRRVEIDGREVYAFPTVWNSIDPRQDVDPFDPQYWKVDWDRVRLQSAAVGTRDQS